MKRFWKYLLGVLLLLVAVVVGGSLYLLSYSLRPDEVMADKDASAREYIREEYPAVRPWLDSLERTGALRGNRLKTVCKNCSMPLRPGRPTVRPSSSTGIPTAPTGC